MKMKLKELWRILKDTFKDFTSRDLSTDGASLAYNAIFSIPGLLIIVIWVAGIFFGEEAIQGEVTRSIDGMMGREAAKSVQEMIVNAMIDKESFWMKIVGIAALVFGSTTLFFQLQKSLNKLWDVEAAPKKAWQKYILDRASSLSMILIISFLLLITFLLSSLIGLLNNWVISQFGLPTFELVYIANIVVGFIVTILLFALMFKVLPDAEIPWKSVWSGAVFTSLLFTLGKYLLTYYFESFKPTSPFGGAGSVILIMMWINYTCQLIFIGAIFTKVYSKRKGLEIKPSAHAKWATTHPEAKVSLSPKADPPVIIVDSSTKTVHDSTI